MSTAYIALGSNLGNRLETIQKAITEIKTKFPILAQSSIYETEPWGVTDQPPFLNAVIKIETDFEPLQLLIFLLALELCLGRNRNNEGRWGPRVIDLDILLYDHLELKTEQLTIPHPRMKERAFVLVPLYEINKEEWVKKALDTLSEKDKNGVKIYTEGT